ncbi:MAG: permease-like cell division protein FtsX, partial [Bdellovibrionales bacterium]|nr:permease-like cell division protein FtsX [Bdellovibrionales bacterium]
MNYFDDLKAQMFKNPTLQVSTCLVIALSFFVSFSLYVLFINLDHIFSGWSNHLQMTVYLDDSVTGKKQVALNKEISSISGVKKTNFIDKDTYKKEFVSKLDSVFPQLKVLDTIDNPFNNGFEVELNKRQDISSLHSWMDGIANKISVLKGVQDVTYGKIWLKEYAQLVLAIKSSASVIIFIVLLSGIFVIANAIKTLISSNREEIEVLEIIGASSSMIQRPYLINGIGVGVISSVLAITLGFMLFEFCLGLFQNHLLSLNINLVFPKPLELLGFLLLGIF